MPLHVEPQKVDPLPRIQRPGEHVRVDDTREISSRELAAELVEHRVGARESCAPISQGAAEARAGRLGCFDFGRPRFAHDLFDGEPLMRMLAVPGGLDGPPNEEHADLFSESEVLHDLLQTPGLGRGLESALTFRNVVKKIEHPAPGLVHTGYPRLQQEDLSFLKRDSFMDALTRLESKQQAKPLFHGVDLPTGHRADSFAQPATIDGGDLGDVGH